MKKLIALIIFAFSAFTSFAQNTTWEYEIIDNGFDGKFKIAHCEDKAGNFVKLFGGQGGNIGMLLYTGYNCVEAPEIEMVLLVNGEWVKYELVGAKSEDSKRIFMFSDIRDAEETWKKASLMRIRHNAGHCGTQIYEFSMVGSSAAFDFMNAL